jgi:hypothetical protein
MSARSKIHLTKYEVTMKEQNSARIVDILEHDLMCCPVYCNIIEQQ